MFKHIKYLSLALAAALVCSSVATPVQASAPARTWHQITGKEALFYTMTGTAFASSLFLYIATATTFAFKGMELFKKRYKKEIDGEKHSFTYKEIAECAGWGFATALSASITGSLQNYHCNSKIR